MPSTTELTYAPIDELRLETENPRTRIDDEQIDALADSIRQHGVLQPLLARPSGDGHLIVVAGGRRLRAAKQAGLTDVPVLVRSMPDKAATLALVENLQRQDLNPIEEATAFDRALAAGMTGPQLAGELNVSEQLIRSRVALLELPAAVQESVADGTVPLRATKELARIAAISPAIAATVAKALADPNGEITAGYLEDQPDDAVATALDDCDDDVWCRSARAGYNDDAGDFAFTDDQVTELQELAAGLPSRRHGFFGYGGKGAWPFNLDEADTDAARAYGCLLEFDSGWRSGWITDRAWLFDRVKAKIETQTKLWEAERARYETQAEKPTSTPVSPADAKVAAKTERQKERAESLAARERNVRLGIALYKELHAPAPTVENMRLLALTLLTYAGDDLGRRGMRYVDEDSQTVTRKKDGTISRVSHLRGTVECRDLLKRRIGKAKTPEQILGVLLQALVASRFADVTAADASDRYGHVRGLGDNYGYILDREIEGLVEKVAEPVLPPEVLDRIREQQAQRELDRQAEFDRQLEDIHTGFQPCPNCGNGREGDRDVDGNGEFAACPCTAEEIEAAIAACPRCGEEDCWATCSAFEPVAEVAEVAGA